MTATINPYESPRATQATPRRRAVAHAMEWLQMLALLVFALATLGGLFEMIHVQLVLGVMSGRLSVDAFPMPPLWLTSILVYSLVLGTPLAMLLFMLVCRRISLPLWIVIVPLLHFDVWMSLRPMTDLLWDSGWDWRGHSWLVDAVSSYTGRAMPFVTLAAFVTLLLIWRTVPRHLWFVIVPALALDVWFICWRIEL